MARKWDNYPPPQLAYTKHGPPAVWGYRGVERAVGRAGLGQNLHRGFLGEQNLSKALVEASLF